MSEEQSRAYTAEEVRKAFLDHLRVLVDYWDKNCNGTRDKLDGLAFSILSTIDGAGALPAFDIVCSPHEDDKAYMQSQGENWYEPGMVINDCQLHELWYQK